MKRREFLELAALGGAAAVAPWSTTSCRRTETLTETLVGTPRIADGARAWDSTGRCYAAQARAHRVEVRDPAGRIIYVLGGESGDLPGTLHNPTAVAAHDDTLFVVEAGAERVRTFDFEGNDRGPLQAAHAPVAPRDVALADGWLWVADARAHRILRYEPNGQFIASLGTLGTGPRDLNGPCSLAVDHRGQLHVADLGNRRVQVFEGHRNVGSYGEGLLFAPRWIRIDHRGHLLVVDAVVGAVFQFSDNGDALAQLELDRPPRSVSVAPDGTLWVSFS